MTDPRADADFSSLSYEQLLEELEQTIARMSSGELGIEEVTDLYERAGLLHDAAAARLQRIRERIDQLTGEPDPSP